MDRGGAKYAIVAIDYFTKWLEAEPMATITSAKVVNFVIKNIICRYGVPYKIIIDNGMQFESGGLNGQKAFQPWSPSRKWTSRSSQQDRQVHLEEKVAESERELD